MTVTSDIKEDIGEFRKATERFYSGGLTVKEYKGISGRYGSYAQRGSEKSMVRLRLAGGSVSKDKLRFIADCIEKYSIDMIHFTTCQAVQLHNLDGGSVCDIIESAFDHGIITLGGGGDCPRNVTASPLSGVEPGEYFDILPYAKITEDYVISVMDSVKLPRKLKIGFSNSGTNDTHATFRDLGFMAREDGTFDVYSAGGLGSNPKLGILVSERVDPGKVLYHVRALIDTFVRYGNYENRSRARTRYMQDSLGKDGYKDAYLESLERCLACGGLDVLPEPVHTVKKGTGCSDRPRVRPQKQEGLYYVSYHPLGGDPEPSKIMEICDAVTGMDGVEIRISPDCTMYIINCTSEEAESIAALTGDGADTLFEASVSCVGSTICQIGLRDSHGLLGSLIEMSRRNGFADGVLPRVHISGCTSSCGTHQIGVIGFCGTSVRTGEGSVPAFNVFADGSHRAGEERFGEPIGVMPESDIPGFLEEVGAAVASEGTVFSNWFRDKEGFLAIARKYTV